VFAGLPMTSLLRGTPDAEIWKSAVCGQVELDAVSRPAQVVYSVVPSVYKYEREKGGWGPSGTLRLTVVELDVVPVDKAANALVDLEVSASAPLRRGEPAKKSGR
jgi:hypothetical protein